MQDTKIANNSSDSKAIELTEDQLLLKKILLELTKIEKTDPDTYEEILNMLCSIHTK